MLGDPLLPGRSRHPGEKFPLLHSARPGLDLVDLCLVLAEAGNVRSLSTLHTIVDRKLCTVVFDIRISHLFTPLQKRDRHRQALLPE